MKYAVLDWDNTIRANFTLFSWMDYLYDKNILDRKIVGEDIAFAQTQYSLGVINHDDFAKSACEIYAKALSGIRKKDYDNLLKEYIEKDQKEIFAFSEDLFRYLYQNSIFPIIISGAPINILNYYSQEYRLYKIFAFSEEFVEDVCTGAVKYNYGVNKRKTLEELIESLGDTPYLAFGDSSSDVPLFELSKHAFCIIDDKSHVGKYGDKPVYLSNTIMGEKLLSIIKNFVR